MAASSRLRDGLAVRAYLVCRSHTSQKAAAVDSWWRRNMQSPFRFDSFLRRHRNIPTSPRAHQGWCIDFLIDPCGKPGLAPLSMPPQR
jgi:hypothetical protein